MRIVVVVLLIIAAGFIPFLVLKAKSNESVEQPSTFMVENHLFDSCSDSFMTNMRKFRMAPPDSMNYYLGKMQAYHEMCIVLRDAMWPKEWAKERK